MPAEHDGSKLFSFQLVFSENFPGRFPYTTLRDNAFTVTGGRVRGAERVVKGENQRWKITVRPSSNDDVTILLPAGSVSTESGRPLSAAVSGQVIGPVGVTVADAKVKEGAGAVLAFAVTLSRAATSAFTVDYATSDGTAQAGADYTAASGTLSFQSGDSSKTIDVSVLDDAHDEGEETLTLTLSNASGAYLADGEATGTIENADLMPAALLARFSRATAEQVVTTIEERMAAPRERGFRARLAGRELQSGQERDFALGLLSQFAQPMGMGPAGAGPMAMGSSPAGAGTAGMGCAMGTGGAPGMTAVAGAMGGGASMTMGPRAAGGLGAGAAGMGCAMGAAGMGGMGGAMGMGGMGMPGQQASMGGAVGPAGYGSMDAAHGGGLFDSMGMGGDLLSNSEFELNRESRGGILSVWSRSSRSHFTGMEDALSLNGDVRTTMFGADWARGALTLGLSVGRTLGLGGYSGASGGQMTTSMTGFYPWVGYQVSERVSVWGVTGYGTGVAEPDAERPVGIGDGRVDDDVGGGHAGRADRLAGHGRVRAGVQGRRAHGDRGERPARQRGRPAERLRGGGDAGAHGARGLAGLHARRRPAVAQAERRGGPAPRRRRRRDGRGHGRGRRARVHRRGHGAVARRAGADAGGAPGRRVHRPRDVAVAGVGPDAVEPAGADRAGGPVVGRSGAGRGRGACGATRWPTAWARTRCTGPADSSTRRWATGCRWAPASWGRRASA